MLVALFYEVLSAIEEKERKRDWERERESLIDTILPRERDTTCNVIAERNTQYIQYILHARTTTTLYKEFKEYYEEEGEKNRSREFR